MTIIYSNTPQRTPEWFAERLGKISGSVAGDVMNFTAKGEPGAGRKNLITRLAVERITGQQFETYQNAAMLRGIELEPIARSAYEICTGEFVEEVGVCFNSKYSNIVMSSDGLTESNGMIEIKAPDSPHKHLSALLNASHATEYKWQIQFQLWIAEREYNDAVSYDPRFPKHLQLAIVRVKRDDDLIAKLEAECLKVEAEINLVIEQLMEKAA